jgi:hypothetical protein
MADTGAGPSTAGPSTAGPSTAGPSTAPTAPKTARKTAVKTKTTARKGRARKPYGPRKKAKAGGVLGDPGVKKARRFKPGSKFD